MITIWDSIVLGIVEGLTEFLPVSSTGHLTIVSKLLGLPIDDPSITGYTAVIQVGAIAAVVKPDELSEEYVVPSVFNRDVAPAVAAAVAAAAESSGVARRRQAAQPA